MLIKKQKLTRIKSLRPADAMQGIDTPEGPTTRALQIEIHKAKQEAQGIKSQAQKLLKEAEGKLEEAGLEARDLISSAKEEAGEIKKQAYIEAKNKAFAEANVIKEQAKTLMVELFEVKKEALHQAHTQIIGIALDLAEKILKHQATIDTDTLKTQVVEAIKKATTEADHVKVYVNSEEHSILQGMIPEIKSLFPSEIEIVLFSDESIDKGSCIVETKSGQLDATFTTQLETLRNIVSHLEVEEPSIESTTLEEANIPAEQIPQESTEGPMEEGVDLTEELTIQGDPLTESEEKILESEVLSNEPLVEEKSFDLESRLEEEALPPSTSEEKQRFNLEETLEAETLPPAVAEPKQEPTVQPEIVQEEKAFDLEAKMEEESLPPTTNKAKQEQVQEAPVQPMEEKPPMPEAQPQIDDEEPLIQEPKQEESFPFATDKEEVETPQAQSSEPVVKEKIKETPQSEPDESGKKKLQINVEKVVVEDDASQGFEELEEEEEEKINTSSILKPKKGANTEQKEEKKPDGGDVSSIADEVEKSSEWKDLLQDEDDE